MDGVSVDDQPAEIFQILLWIIYLLDTAYDLPGKGGVATVITLEIASVRRDISVEVFCFRLPNFAMVWNRRRGVVRRLASVDFFVQVADLYGGFTVVIGGDSPAQNHAIGEEY